MAEVIHVFNGVLLPDGATYDVQVCGRSAGNIWEGWLEFASATGRGIWRTPRETTQSNREALEYWARGLSTTYFEGALERATNTPVSAPRATVAEPYFDAPGPSVVTPEPVVGSRAVLDPFSVAAKGEFLLRQELGALRGWHLRNIVRAYNLADPSRDLEALSEPELVELIVDAVQST